MHRDQEIVFFFKFHLKCDTDVESKPNARRIFSEISACGIEKVYVAEDTGSPDALQRCRLPKKIHLKINSPVILLVNLSDELVNGLVGIVTDMKQDSVTVHFDSLERNFEMKKHMFPIYDIKLKKDIACRSQIPLKLAFALTVHRAQGLTLNRVHVHCRYMLQPGQVAVAFSRVRMKKDLRVSDFSEKVVVKPPAEIEEFYCQIQALKKPDLKCCRNFELKEMETETSSESSYQPGETDEISEEQLIEEEMKIAEIVDKVLEEQQVEHSLPETLSVADLLNGLLHKNAVTLNQQEENDCLKFLLHKDISKFLDFLWNSLFKIKEKVLTSADPLDNKTTTLLYQEMFNFQKSNEYVSHINLLFEKPPGQSQFNVCYKLFCELRKFMLDKVAEPIRSSYREKAETERGKVYKESEGGLEKIRYIAGWCISSLKKHKRVAIQEKLYRPKEIESLRRLKTEIDLLGELESNESSPEIERKQNIRKGLTNVTDSCSNFFQKLDKEIRQLETETNINIYGKNIGNFIKTTIMNNQTMLNAFSSLFILQSEKEMEVLPSLFEDLISKYSMMSLSQLRKEYLNLVKVKKTEAHRKQIKMRTKKKAEKFNIQTFLNDKSDGKLSSHRRLQSEIAANEHYLVDSFTKKDIILLGKYYQLHFSSTATKKDICTLLSKKVMEEERALSDVSENKEEKEKIPRKRYHTDTVFQKKVHAGDRESQNEPSSSGSKEVSPKTKGEKYTEKRTLRGKGKAKKKRERLNIPVVYVVKTVMLIVYCVMDVRPGFMTNVQM
ncbi:hypothetical protein KUTeg_016316 [Tegillarca granosa]|uniref:ATP-dependent DNA helicase PIF1 n=1 Tax=Tegillarca granosa TaxID=220873 RepID=A0ABQ9EPC2_TEGGR|nr:hypothetical protein KUTeg_016316 [Tegillarca granosa]